MSSGKESPITKDLNLNWKDENEFNETIDTVIKNFSAYFAYEAHDYEKLINEFQDENNNFSNFNQDFFNYLKQELEICKNDLILSQTNEDEKFNCMNSNLKIETNNIQKKICFAKLCRLLSFCLIISKNLECLNLLIRTSCISILVYLSIIVLNNLNSFGSIKYYLKHCFFLFIRAYDPYFNWFKKYYNLRVEKKENNEKLQITPLCDMAILDFIKNSFEILKHQNRLNESNISVLSTHLYAVILNQYIEQNEFVQMNNIAKIIDLPILELLFKLLNENDVLLRDQNEYFTIEMRFYDKNSIICVCLPMIIIILHSSKQTNRVVDLNIVLDKMLYSFENNQHISIKLELLKAYLNILSTSSDRAALKTILATKHYLNCLIKQTYNLYLTINIHLHRSIFYDLLITYLSLIKILFEKTDSIKENFLECDGYSLLYNIFKQSLLMDEAIMELFKDMISESTNKTRYELVNCQMAALLIKLLPFLEKEQKIYILDYLCKICTLNHKNQFKACKENLLFNFIEILSNHQCFESFMIDRLFSTIQILGCCSINRIETYKLVSYLKPKLLFPYGIKILRCILFWAKHTTPSGLNIRLFNIETDDKNFNLKKLKSNDKEMNEKSSVITVNHKVLDTIMRSIGNGAISANAQHQPKTFFEFEHNSSGIRVSPIKRWPGYGFSFHAWIKLSTDLEKYDKKRRQLYSFYTDDGHGFEAFFTPDCSSLIISVCTKKEYISLQIREIDLSSNQIIINDQNETKNGSETNNLERFSNEIWHSICVSHIPAKNPFSYSQICVFIDGILKKETDFRMPNFNDSFTHIRIGGSCVRPNNMASNSNIANSLSTFYNFKNIFNLGRSGITEKTLNISSIPYGSQDAVWEASTCLMGQMSSCFVMHDTINNIQVRLLYELGPNYNYSNWLEIKELSDLRSKILFHYDAKCTKNFSIFDLSQNKILAKFTGQCFSRDNFKESFNSIGSIQVFYPFFNYISSNPEYLDLVLNQWNKYHQYSEKIENHTNKNFTIGNNAVSLALDCIRYFIHNSHIMQIRFMLNNNVALLGFLLERLPKEFIDINLLRSCQDFVSESFSLQDKKLLYSFYDSIIFQFNIWNKADYSIRIGHITYISTIIKDDKKYFRKNYGVQFFLDIIKTYFDHKLTTNNDSNDTISNMTQVYIDQNTLLIEEEIKHLRNSLLSLIKFYIQREIKLNELNAILSFLSTTQNASIQLIILDMLISLLETPNQNDQLNLLLIEPNMADSFYGILVQPEIDYKVQHKLLKIIEILLKTKKVNDKYKSRLRLDECGTYAGLISKLIAEHSLIRCQNMSVHLNDYIVVDLLENFMINESNNLDNIWHIVSLTTLSMPKDLKNIIITRTKICAFFEKILKITNNIRLLVKSLAWQDIVCKLFCIEKRTKENLENNTKSNIPPIIISAVFNQENSNQLTPNLKSKSNIVLSPINKKKEQISKVDFVKEEYQNEINGQDFDDWDNFGIPGITNQRIHKLLKSESIKSENDNTSLITSTPSKIRSSDFSVYRIKNNDNQKDLLKIVKNKNVYIDYEKYYYESLIESKINHDDKFDKNLYHEINDLCEKIVLIAFKLTWDGIMGSNQDSWRDRCQLFSSLEHLMKEYYLIKPIDYILHRFFELSLERLNLAWKKTSLDRDQTDLIENSREIIKQIDCFITAYGIGKISENFISMTISLLDNMQVFNQTKPTRIQPFSYQLSTDLADQLISQRINQDDSSETNYLAIDILLNAIKSSNIEICAQAAAKLNTFLHSKLIQNDDEASYFIVSIHKIIVDRLNENDENHYAFLMPILKGLIEKNFIILQMKSKIPNFPLNRMTNTFYEYFKEYCRSKEWLDFIEDRLVPLRDQYLAMTLNPSQMNMKIWSNNCHEALMISIHKRNRIIGESKIQFEQNIYNIWKEREKQENQRFQNFKFQKKKKNLEMRKQLHGLLDFYTSERGIWYEENKENYWMLSNHENQLRMRCKLVKNLQFDSHFEASRLRDSTGFIDPSISDARSNINILTNCESHDHLTNKLRINKEAINSQIKEDMIGDDEITLAQSQNQILNKSLKNEQQIRSHTSINLNNNTDITQAGDILSSSTQNYKQQEYNDSYLEFEETEKLLIKSECELITMAKVIKGRFELTNKYLYFVDTFSSLYSEKKSCCSSVNEKIVSFTNNSYNGLNCHDFDILNDFKVPLFQIKDVQLRRYNLRRSALEFFLINETNFFINFNKSIRNKIYSKIVSLKLPQLQSFQSVRTPGDLLKATDYTQRWVNHEITNFEYLMKLNTIAGRTYNDLSQYPVFPWVLQDYTSEILDLNDPHVFRDLSKPIGVLNKKYENYVRQKFECFEDPSETMKPFHYGTHYSNSANVMHFLVRVEPFTTLHIQLQSDRFDLADRQFHSLPSSWKILNENPTDVKELIPEFYYFPEFLENTNNFDLGELQITKRKVHNVTLPPWAKDSEHFIYLHRKALESDYVSEHLNEWIDLIFGYKQQGPEAVKALNVFMYYSYEGAIDLDSISDPIVRQATEGMISNFGQTPTQLLKEPHPKRKNKEQTIKERIIQGKPLIIWHVINNLKAYYVEFCEQKNSEEDIDPIVFIGMPRNYLRSFMQHSLADPLISITQSGLIGVNGWQSNESSETSSFVFEKDPSLLNENTKKCVSGPFDPKFILNRKIYALSIDSKLLFTGAHWDNSLRVFSMSKYRNISQIYQHNDIVSCLAIDNTGTILVSGSYDTSCIIWQVIKIDGTSVNLDPTPINILYGHSKAVTSVDISLELDMVISGSEDGTINIHTIYKGNFVRTLFLEKESLLKNTYINLKLSNERYILVYMKTILLDFSNKEQRTANQVNFDKLYLYSINGKLISTEFLNYQVHDMIIKDNYCILAGNFDTQTNMKINPLLGKDNSKKTDSRNKNSYPLSKLIFKEAYSLNTIQTIKLKNFITSIYLTNDESHLLVGLKDGKLIVITGERIINL